MPLGNPFQAPAAAQYGYKPQSPASSRPFGSSLFGNKAMQKPGAPSNFGIDPLTGRPITDPKEAEAMLDENTQAGQGLKRTIYNDEAQRIAAMRRQLMQGQQQQ